MGRASQPGVLLRRAIGASLVAAAVLCLAEAHYISAYEEMPRFLDEVYLEEYNEWVILPRYDPYWYVHWDPWLLIWEDVPALVAGIQADMPYTGKEPERIKVPRF